MLVEKQTIPAAALSEDSKHGRLLIDMAFECCSAIGVWPRGRGCNTSKIRVVVRVLVLSPQCSKQCKLFSSLAADQSVELIVSTYSLVAKMKDNRLKRNQSLLPVCQTTTKAALSIDLTARAASRALSLAHLNVAHKPHDGKDVIKKIVQQFIEPCQRTVGQPKLTPHQGTSTASLPDEHA